MDLEVGDSIAHAEGVFRTNKRGLSITHTKGGGSIAHAESKRTEEEEEEEEEEV